LRSSGCSVARLSRPALGGKVADKVQTVFVYVLYSRSLEKYYVGQTNDLEDRLKRHNSGNGKYQNRYSLGIDLEKGNFFAFGSNASGKTN
jgi:hypothetical protein